MKLPLLASTAQSGVERPFLQISTFEQVSNQPQKPLIVDFLAKNAVTPRQTSRQTPSGKSALSTSSDQIAIDDSCGDVLGNHDHRQVGGRRRKALNLKRDSHLRSALTAEGHIGRIVSLPSVERRTRETQEKRTIPFLLSCLPEAVYALF